MLIHPDDDEDMMEVDGSGGMVPRRVGQSISANDVEDANNNSSGSMRRATRRTTRRRSSSSSNNNAEAEDRSRDISNRPGDPDDHDDPDVDKVRSLCRARIFRFLNCNVKLKFVNNGTNDRTRRCWRMTI